MTPLSPALLVSPMGFQPCQAATCTWSNNTALYYPRHFCQLLTPIQNLWRDLSSSPEASQGLIGHHYGGLLPLRKGRAVSLCPDCLVPCRLARLADNLQQERGHESPRLRAGTLWMDARLWAGQELFRARSCCSKGSLSLNCGVSCTGVIHPLRSSRKTAERLLLAVAVVEALGQNRRKGGKIRNTAVFWIQRLGTHLFSLLSQP